MEKESLEEVANEYAKNRYSQEQGHPDEDYYISFLSFKAGAKWQQERSYSESNKIMKFLDTEVELGLSDIKTIERIKWYFKTYFEQFKKK